MMSRARNGAGVGCQHSTLVWKWTSPGPGLWGAATVGTFARLPTYYLRLPGQGRWRVQQPWATSQDACYRYLGKMSLEAGVSMVHTRLSKYCMVSLAFPARGGQQGLSRCTNDRCRMACMADTAWRAGRARRACTRGGAGRVVQEGWGSSG